jgi:hypothetical protein
MDELAGAPVLIQAKRPIRIVVSIINTNPAAPPRVPGIATALLTPFLTSKKMSQRPITDLAHRPSDGPSI